MIEIKIGTIDTLPKCSRMIETKNAIQNLKNTKKYVYMKLKVVLNISDWKIEGFIIPQVHHLGWEKE